MRINNNLMAMNTHRQLGLSNAAGARSMGKLSSGYRINGASDDAAGLAISEKMRAQIRGLGQASRNSQDAISLVQTAEGALNETQAILQRMRELAVQSATDTNVAVDRSALQAEINELAGEITRISETTEFNTQSLLNGNFKGTFHIGANEGQNMKLTISDMSAQALQVSGSGEGKATYEITGTGAASNNPSYLAGTGLVAGEQTLSVVEINNVTITDGLVANYGLANDAGEIVAVSQSGKDYELLNGAYKVSDLAGASVAHADDDINFSDAVISGEVTLTAAANGTITDVKATASIGVEGLATGDYVVELINGNFADYFGSGKIEVAATNGIADADINSVLLNSDGEVVAVEFVNGTTTTANANKFYSLESIDFTASNATAGTRIDTALTNAEAIMTSSSTVTDGQTFSIKADGGIDISTQEKASAAITTINNALESVSAERAKLGAVQNRLDHTIKNLDTSAENLQASESRIRDVDMAKEMMEFTKNNILQQAAQAMLAQANQAPQGVLQLLR